MTYKERINSLKEEYAGSLVEYMGEQYTVVDVDYNGALLLNKPAEFTATTAVPITDVKVIQSNEERETPILSQVYEYNDRCFRYNYDRGLLQHVREATPELAEANDRHVREGGNAPFEIIDGYWTIDNFKLDEQDWDGSPEYWCKVFSSQIEEKKLEIQKRLLEERRRKMKYVTFTTDGSINIIDAESKTGVVSYDALKEMLAKLPTPIDWFECVYLNLMGKRYVMLVDEEGKLKGLPYNSVATQLYSMDARDCIVGDALILRDKGDGEMYLLTDDDVNMFEGETTEVE